MLTRLSRCKSAWNLFQDLIHAFPAPVPALSAHKPCSPGWRGSCTLSMLAEITKTKTLWHFFIFPHLLDFSKYLAISQSSICCTAELLSKCRTGVFPLSITVNRLASSLIHSFKINTFFHSFFFFWFNLDIFLSAFSNVSKLAPERFRIYENASSKRLLSRFLLRYPHLFI